MANLEMEIQYMLPFARGAKRANIRIVLLSKSRGLFLFAATVARD